jgi:hypothetical protein
VARNEGTKDKVEYLLDRIKPTRPRTKLIDWPLEVRGERPQIMLRVLGGPELDAAYLAAEDALRGDKRGSAPKAKPGSAIFLARERAELVWRGVLDIDGQPIAKDAETLYAEHPALVDALHAEWKAHQASFAAPWWTAAELEEIIDRLKKTPSRVRRATGLPVC